MRVSGGRHRAERLSHVSSCPSSGRAVQLNVVLASSIELSGFLLVVVIGVAAIADGGASIDTGRVLEFKHGEGIVPAIMGGPGNLRQRFGRARRSLSVAETR
jgi:hypothetical protein